MARTKAVQYSGAAGAGAERDTFVGIQQLNGGSGDDDLWTYVGTNPNGGETDYGSDPNTTGPTYGTVLAGSGGNDTMQLAGPYEGQPGYFGLFQPTLYGGTGEDWFTFDGLSNGAIYGQGGNDVLYVGEYDDVGLGVVDGGDGVDLQTVRYAGAHLHAYGDQLAPGFENAELYATPDFFRGNGLNNVITVHGAGESVYDGAGNDRIVIMDGQYHELFGDAGNDVLTGGDNGQRMHGGDGNDSLYGYGGNDVLYGDGGRDMLQGNSGYDALFGGTGDDLLSGGTSSDYLEGNDGNDRLLGESGNDTLRGNGGPDRFEGGIGDDVLYARDGQNDSLYGGDGIDRADRDSAEAIIDSVEVRV